MQGSAAACCAGVLLGLVTAVGCESQSLVPIDVLGDAPFSNVQLRILPSVGHTKVINDVSISSTTPLEIGIYLPEKASGTVQLAAEAVDGSCVVGRGAATATDVRAGLLSAAVTLRITHVTGCEPPSGGTGETGAGGAASPGAGGGAGATDLRRGEGTTSAVGDTERLARPTFLAAAR